MTIGWIAGAIGLAGLGLTALALHGRRGVGPAAPRRRMWLTFVVGALITITSIVCVSIPSFRKAPLLAVMPTDVLIAAAEVIPRPWLYEPLPRGALFFGSVDGDALNQRKLSDAQKRKLTQKIDAMLARQESLEAFGELSAARPMWDANGVPLSDEARLTLLDLLATRVNIEPEYDPEQDFDGFLDLLGLVGAGFGSGASEGFREPDHAESAVVYRFIEAITTVPIEDAERGSITRVAIWMQLLGPWFLEAVPTLLEWSKQADGESARTILADAAILTLTQTGAWSTDVRDIAIGLMRSDNERIATIACMTPLPEDEVARVYESTLREVVFDRRSQGGRRVRPELAATDGGDRQRPLRPSESARGNRRRGVASGVQRADALPGRVRLTRRRLLLDADGAS